jgi:3-dehydroquinate synthase
VKTVRLALPERPYDVLIGAGVRRRLADVARQARAGQVVVISDQQVGALHAATLVGELHAAGVAASLLTVPAGEGSKSPVTAAHLWDELAQSGADRQTLVVACGGGVVGDLAGFVAATYARGLRYVQVPTTLLAMVDSAIGGKTALNLSAGKNLVGAFHQPEAVLADLDYLRTLPPAEYETGWAEILKCAVVADAALFGRLATQRPSGAGLEDVIGRCAEIKAGVVVADERDQGARAILNYGHTLGHALETTLGYGALSHGRAVAWGMVVAGQLSVRLGECAPEAAAAQDAALQAYGLLAPPSTIPRWEKLAGALAHDKKRVGGDTRWVLLQEIGRAVPGRSVPLETVRTVTEEVMAGARARDPRT